LRGRANAAIEADISEDHLRHFFVREGDHYRVRQELRDLALQLYSSGTPGKSSSYRRTSAGTTLIRVGNDDYAKQNNTYGLTTLKNRHVAVDGNEVRFRFAAKGGNCRDVMSTDVNEYLKEITNKDFRAKDFRTWAGTVLAAALNELEGFDSAAQAKRMGREGGQGGLVTACHGLAEAGEDVASHQRRG
jgi:hypothetical protein